MGGEDEEQRVGGDDKIDIAGERGVSRRGKGERGEGWEKEGVERSDIFFPTKVQSKEAWVQRQPTWLI